VVDAGSDAISLINTLPGMAIDIETRRFRIANRIAGLSVPGLKPVAVRMVFQAREAVTVPILGMGGIYSAADAIEFLMAGANAVAIGTAIFSNPGCLVEIIDGIDAWLDRHGIANVNDIVGVMHQAQA